jgi:hypothetical protein
MPKTKRAKNLLMLAALVIVVVGYAIYDYRSDEKMAEQKENASLLFTLKPEQVSQLKIKNGSGEFTLVRDKDGWKITAPIHDSADNTAVNEYLAAAVDEKSTTVAMEGPQIDWKQYGLDEPRGTLALADNSGHTNSVAVGKVKNFQGDAFIRKNNDNKVLVAANTWFTRIDQSLMGLRDKRIYRGSLQGVQSLSLNGYHMLNKNGQWVSAEHPDDHLDQNKVRELLSMLSQTSGLEIIAEGKITAKENSEWGFKKPAVSVVLISENGRKWKADFAQVKNITRVHVSEPEVVYKIAPSDLGKFQSADLDSLRDKAEPFQFDRAAVSEVDLHLPPQEKKLKMQDQLTELLTKLHALNAIEYVNDRLSAQGTLTLRDSQGKEIFSFQWGNRQKRKYDGIENSVYLAKTSLSPNAFTILVSDIDDLKLNQFLPSQKENKK